MYGLAFLTVSSGKSDPMIQHFKFLTVLELGNNTNDELHVHFRVEKTV